MAAIAGTPESDDELELLKQSIRQRQMNRDASAQDAQSPLRDILVGVGSLGYGAGTGQSAPALAQGIYDRIAQRDQARIRQEALDQNHEIQALSALAKQRAADKAKREELPIRFQLEQEKQLAYAQAMGANQQQLEKMRAANVIARQSMMGDQAKTKQESTDAARRELQELMGNQKLEQIKTQAKAKPAGSAKAAKPPAQNEFQAAGFSKRAEEAEAALGELISSGFNPSATSVQYQGMIPHFAEGLKSQDVKAYEQAKTNFISAILRKESGAAISETEYKNEDKKYFPQAGDSGSVLDQKKQARAQAVNNLRAEGARALPLISTAPMIKGTSSGGISREDALKELKRRGLTK